MDMEKSDVVHLINVQVAQIWFVQAILVHVLIHRFGTVFLVVNPTFILCFTFLFEICLNVDFFSKESIGSYYESCTFDSGCDSTKSLICAVSGENTLICDCPSTFYWSGTTSSCQSKLLNTVTCSNTTQCRTDLGLYCDVGVTNRCKCPANQFWDGHSCGIFC